MERPKRTDDYIIKLAGEKLADLLMEWSEHESIGVIQDAARKLARKSCYLNAYELAKEFEEMGFEPDLPCVEILDRAYDLVRDVHRSAVQEWVKGWPIKSPVFNMNDLASVVVGGKTYEGTVIGIDPKLAMITVNCVAAGHKEGEGYYVEIEKASEVPF